MAIITNKSIFYRIPKTGSTWVNWALKHSMKGKDNFVYRRPRAFRGRRDSPYYWERTTAQLLGLVLGHSTQWRVSDGDKEGLFSFAFVREPLSWYKSFWAERAGVQERHGNKPWKKYFLLDFVWDPNFEKFIENALDMFPFGAVSTTYRCFLGENGDMLDFVGRQENLREDLIKALTLAGEDFDEKVIRKMSKINARTPSVTPIKISDELKEAVEQRESWVISKFYKK